MNTEKEINELKEKFDELESKVDRVIDWVNENFGGGGGGGAAEEATSDDLYEVVSFDVKKKPAEMVGEFWSGQSYAWKLTVKNTSPQKITLIGTVVFLDSDGFDVESYPMEALEVKANSTQTNTGLARILQQHSVSQVKEITCKFDVR